MNDILIVIISVLAGAALTYLYLKLFAWGESTGENASQSLNEASRALQRFASAQDFCNLSYVEVDSDFKVVYSDQDTDILFSSTGSTLIDTSLRSIISEEHLPNKEISAVFSGAQKKHSFLMKFRHQLDDSPIDLRVCVKPVYDNMGKVYKVQILFRDCTEELSVQGNLSKSRGELEQLKNDNKSMMKDSLKTNDKLRKSIRIVTDNFVCAPTGLIVLDKNGIINNFNRAAENLFNYHGKDVTGKGIDALHTSRSFKDDFLSGTENGSVIEGEIDCIKSDLSHFVGMVRVKTIYDEKHEIIRYVLSVNDITKRARFQRDILLKNHELQSINDIFMSANQYNKLETKLNVFLDKLFDNLKVVRKGLIYLKSDTNTLELNVYKGFHFSQLQDVKQLEISRSFCGDALHKNKIIVSACVSEDDVDGLSDELKEHDISDNHIFIPVRHKSEPLGVLVIFPNKNYHFERDDLEFFAMLGEELAICVKQALEFEELSGRVADLTEPPIGKKNIRESSA